MVDLSDVWLEVGGVVAPVFVADFLFSYLQWLEDQSNPFEAKVPSGWEMGDLLTVGYLLANEEAILAQEMIDNLIPRQDVKASNQTTLMEANDNYLKKNPFRRRKQTKVRGII